MFSSDAWVAVAVRSLPTRVSWSLSYVLLKHTRGCDYHQSSRFSTLMKLPGNIKNIMFLLMLGIV